MSGDYQAELERGEIVAVPGFPDYFARRDGAIFTSRSGKRKLGPGQISLRLLSPYPMRYPRNRGGDPDFLAVQIIDPDGISRTRSVHQIIMKTFGIPNPEGRKLLRHKDGDYCNNHIDNIEYMTQRPLSDILASAATKLKPSDIPEIRALRRSGMSCAKIGERYGVSREGIRNIIRGKSWTTVPNDQAI